MSVHGSGPGRPQRARPGRRSRGDLRRPLLPGQGPLSRVPPVAVFAAVALVFVGGVVVGGVLGALLLGVLAVGVAVLLATAWSRLRPPERVGRVLVLAVLVLVAVSLLARGGVLG